MHYIVLTLSTLIQLCFAGLTFLFILFSAAGIANNNELSGVHEFIFTLAIIVIPSSSIVIAPTILYLAVKRTLKLAYWWHALPVAMAMIYCLYIIQFE